MLDWLLGSPEKEWMLLKFCGLITGGEGAGGGRGVDLLRGGDGGLTVIAGVGVDGWFP